jgi:hypothetical protein
VSIEPILDGLPRVGRLRLALKRSRILIRQEASMKSNDHPKREEKKKPEKSLKEKRAEKKAKKENKPSE